MQVNRKLKISSIALAAALALGVTNATGTAEADGQPERALASVSVDRELRPLQRQARKQVRKATRPTFDSPQSLGVSRATLESIAVCESGGDPAIVSSSGTYRGKYQFDLGTWASVGGSGDPAAAPEAEQDYRAALLYSRAGATPWPTCGS